MNICLWVVIMLSGCGLKKLVTQSMDVDVIKEFETEIEKFVWLSFQANRSMMFSIRCIVDVLE